MSRSLSFNTTLNLFMKPNYTYKNFNKKYFITTLFILHELYNKKQKNIILRKNSKLFKLYTVYRSQTYV